MGTALASIFLVASVVTIIPALGFLFYLLNRYEGYFEDARVFFSLTVGFFVGMFANLIPLPGGVGPLEERPRYGGAVVAR